MVYGNGLWGVTEANYCVVLLHYTTAAMGPSRWLWRPLAGLAASAPAVAVLPPAVRSLLGALQLNEIASFSIAGLAALMAVEQLFRVFRLAGTRQLASTTLPKAEQGHKQLGRARAAAHLMQLAAVFVLGVPLLALPTTVAGPPQVVMITFGVVYAIQVHSRRVVVQWLVPSRLPGRQAARHGRGLAVFGMGGSCRAGQAGCAWCVGAWSDRPGRACARTCAATADVAAALC
jgi:hypothetical protein